MSDWGFLNRHRIRDGFCGTSDDAGFNGAFRLRINEMDLKVIASDGYGWEHVSVSLALRPTWTPSWEIMCKVKDLFWDPEVTVMQLHPPKSLHVNNHPGCLHLWRPAMKGVEIPLPHPIMVGIPEGQQ